MGSSFCADYHYETQNKQWISNLAVNEICDNDCCLFLWVTSPLLEEQGIDVLKSWGFKYVTIAFCWSKYTKNNKLVSNPGRWTMSNIELCLLGTKGHPNYWRQDFTIKQLVQAERTEHSRKPDEVRKRIVELLGDRSRIELFAREKTPGWDVWGNEVESDISIEVITPEEAYRRSKESVKRDNFEICNNAEKLNSADFADGMI